MAPRKKENAEPTRRSTRTVSQSSTVLDTTSAPKKREIEDHAIENKAPESKKAKNALGVGDKLPNIALQDEDGNSINIVDITSEKGIILFAYPKASTPGCTKQVYFSFFMKLIVFFSRHVDFVIFSLRFLRKII
jgi:peroxiredoxin Q/BCP